MSNRFFTILVMRENSSEVKRVVIPSWILKGSLVIGVFAVVMGVIMVFDYWYISNQVGENRDLKIENRKLRQQVQVFRNKLYTIENTMDRIENFATRLRVISDVKYRQSSARNERFTDSLQTSAEKQKATPLDFGTDNIGSVRERTEEVEQNLQDLYSSLVDRKNYIAASPTRRPATGYFASSFGVRRHPFTKLLKMHEGIDIANHIGTDIIAAGAGTIKYAGRKAGYGITVVIDHGYGVETWYGHTSRLLVKKGERVRKGQKIALMGNTGRSTGPHVHYEVRVKGSPVDPISYILEY